MLCYVPPLSSSACFCQFLSVSISFCQFLSVSVRFYPLLSVLVRLCPFMSVKIRLCPFMSFSVRFCLFLSVGFLSCPGQLKMQKTGWNPPKQIINILNMWKPSFYCSFTLVLFLFETLKQSVRMVNSPAAELLYPFSCNTQLSCQYCDIKVHVSASKRQYCHKWTTKQLKQSQDPGLQSPHWATKRPLGCGTRPLDWSSVASVILAVCGLLRSNLGSSLGRICRSSGCFPAAGRVTLIMAVFYVWAVQGFVGIDCRKKNIYILLMPPIYFGPLIFLTD